MVEHAKTLVLDSRYQPIGVVSWKKAITLFFSEKVEILQEYTDLYIRSAYHIFKVPSVIRFTKSVIKKFRKVKFTRENVFIRDSGCCQYCGDKVSKDKFTLDHVIPRSKKGKTNFSNVVVACRPCNYKKGDFLLSECGMKIINKPYTPTLLDINKKLYSDWSFWLGE